MRALMYLLGLAVFAFSAGAADESTNAGGIDCTCEVKQAGNRLNAWEQKTKNLFDKADANGDHKLSKDETDALHRDADQFGNAGKNTDAAGKSDVSAQLKNFDLNKDGKLDKQEQQVLFSSVSAYEQALKQFDKNNDGQLSDDERKQAISAAYEHSLENFLNKADANGDGQLDVQEFAGLFDRIADNFEQRLDRVLECFDADKDGKLSADERKAARDALAGAWKKHHEAVMQKFDKNHDGKLSAEEVQAMRDSRQSPEIDCVCFSRDQKADTAKSDANPGSDNDKQNIKAGTDRQQKEQ